MFAMKIRLIAAVIGAGALALVASLVPAPRLEAAAPRAAAPPRPGPAARPPPATRPAPPSLAGVRILDSTNFAGRPQRLHPSRHMLRADTPHSYWSPRRSDIDLKAFHIRRTGSVAT